MSMQWIVGVVGVSLLVGYSALVGSQPAANEPPRRTKTSMRGHPRIKWTDAAPWDAGRRQVSMMEGDPMKSGPFVRCLNASEDSRCRRTGIQASNTSA